MKQSHYIIGGVAIVIIATLIWLYFDQAATIFELQKEARQARAEAQEQKESNADMWQAMIGQAEQIQQLKDQRFAWQVEKQDILIRLEKYEDVSEFDR